MADVAVVVEEIRASLGDVVVWESGGVVATTPRSAEEVAAVLRFCNAAGLRVEIAGAGTKRAWGGVAEADVVLETSGLRGVREHSWQDLTATVGAGTTWAEMQQVLAAHGQMVALDPLWEERATVGGVLATNDSGVLRLKYGSARDLVIGMTIVLADGTIAKSGGKVVKNVAGYDLHKLMIGAFGTLGVIAEVTFRLHPMADTLCTWSAAADVAEPVGEMMLKVLDSQMNPEAMQVRASDECYAIDVLLKAMPQVLAEKIATLERMRGAVDGLKTSAQCDGAEVFSSREELFGEDGVVVKATMLPAAIAGASATAVRRGGVAVTQATGVMFARFDELSSTEGLVGDVAVLRGDASVRVLGGGVWSVMREIKQRFDAKRILNRGLMGGV